LNPPSRKHELSAQLFKELYETFAAVLAKALNLTAAVVLPDHFAADLATCPLPACKVHNRG